MYAIPVRTCKHNCNMYCVPVLHTCMRIHVRTCKQTGDMYCIPVLRTGMQYRYCVPVRTCKHNCNMYCVPVLHTCMRYRYARVNIAYKSTRPNLANYPLQSLRIYRSVTMKFRTTTASEIAQWQLACIGEYIIKYIIIIIIILSLIHI